MVDSAKTFIIVVISFIVALSVISFGVKIYDEKSEHDSALNIGISTTTSVSTTTKKPTTTSGTSAKPQQTNTITPSIKTNYTIRYTNSGFTPVSLRIKAGQSVRFLNESGMTMNVNSVVQPNSSLPIEISQGKSVGKGGYYDFTFTHKGTFIYYNLNDKNKAGAVIVE